MERVGLLLRYLKDFKTKCDFNGIYFEADLASMYTEIRRCLAVYFTVVKPLKEMNETVYEAFKEKRDDEKSCIKKGYDRVKEKIRNVRQVFRAAITKGTRSGSGRIVQDNFELLTEIWGGSSATTSLSFSIDGDTVGTEISSEIDYGRREGMYYQVICSFQPFHPQC